MRSGLSQCVEDAVDIDRLDFLEILKADVEHVAAGNADPRIGDRLVDAPEFPDDGGNARLDGLLVSDIDLRAANDSAERFEFGDGLRILLGLVPPDDDSRAVDREPARHAETDPTVAAGHERNLSRQVEQSPVHRVSPDRYGSANSDQSV